jgi:hypothetical protein
MRLARACLEVDLFPTVIRGEQSEEKWDFMDAWNDYRASEGILDETALHKFFNRYGTRSIPMQSVYFDLAECIGSTTSDALLEWFSKRFRTAPDALEQWPWAFRRLLIEGPKKIQPTSPPPITEAERQRIHSFCVTLDVRSSELRSRFYITEQVAKSTLPSPWEAVLQAYPPGDELGNTYPWLQHVHECLELRLIRKQWTRLAKEVGPDLMKRVTGWVKEQEGLLGCRMPDVPIEEPFIWDCKGPGAFLDLVG